MARIETGLLVEQGHSDGAKQEAFEAQQEMMAKIKAVGFALYVENPDNVPNLAEVFDLEKKNRRRIGCMDDRIGDEDVDVRSAGSGILLSDEEFDEFFEKSGAKEITSHDGCGAVEIWAEREGYDVSDKDLLNRLGREWAEKKAKEKGVPHIDLGNLKESFHGARVLYYDGTGKFSRVEGLPSGFIVGRKNMSEKSSLAEVTAAQDIAFGGHGLGELLSQENPFMLVAVAETEQKLKKLQQELASVSENFGNRIVVDGFVAPREGRMK